MKQEEGNKNPHFGAKFDQGKLALACATDIHDALSLVPDGMGATRPLVREALGILGPSPDIASRIGLVRWASKKVGEKNVLRLYAQAATYGLVKYSRGSWLEVPDGLNRYTDALLRHLMSLDRGVTIDEESGIDHWAHVIWGTLATLQLEINEKKVDKQL